jgi:short-subunit dehydrogenase
MTPYATTKQAVSYFSKALYKETKSTSILTGTAKYEQTTSGGSITKKNKRFIFFQCCTSPLVQDETNRSVAIFNMEGWGSNGEWSPGMTPYATTKQAVSYFSKALYTKHCAQNIS